MHTRNGEGLTIRDFVALLDHYSILDDRFSTCARILEGHEDLDDKVKFPPQEIADAA